jgi:hypothetical protein
MLKTLRAFNAQGSRSSEKKCSSSSGGTQVKRKDGVKTGWNSVWHQKKVVHFLSLTPPPAPPWRLMYFFCRFCFWGSPGYGQSEGSQTLRAFGDLRWSFWACLVVCVAYPTQIEVVLVLKLVVTIEESKDTPPPLSCFLTKIIHFRTAPRSSYETYKLGWFSDKPGKDPMKLPLGTMEWSSPLPTIMVGKVVLGSQALSGELHKTPPNIRSKGVSQIQVWGGERFNDFKRIFRSHDLCVQ